ncbi:hypothetical protein FACS1894218_7420 [Bacilli bacterium]|nr:hypothetical protein FACS1894218_7420 [Bacilli bacterium]
MTYWVPKERPILLLIEELKKTVSLQHKDAETVKYNLKGYI